MLAETTSALSQLSNLLPHIALIAGICGVAGWSLRGMLTKPAPAKPLAAAAPARDRSKNLEASLEKSKAAQKSLKAELEGLKAHSVSVTELEKAHAALEAASKSLENETKRISAVEADLKKAQDTIKNLNTRANDADKAQKDRSFNLENELSKARQQLAILEARPDDTAVLHTEIERLRESVAVSTRYAGEVRKREVAAVEALEKAQTQLAEMSTSPRPAAVVSKKVGPVADSDRVTAAKAEVLRLLESNKQAALVAEPEAVVIEPDVAAIEPEVAAIEPEAAVIESEVAAIEPAVVAIEPEAAPAEHSPAPKKVPVHGDLFAVE